MCEVAFEALTKCVVSTPFIHDESCRAHIQATESRKPVTVEKPEESKLIVILSGFGINSVMTKLLPCCRIKYGQSISFCTTPPRRTISPLNSRAVVCPVQIWQSVPVRYPPKHSKSNVCACPFCSAAKANWASVWAKLRVGFTGVA